MGALYRGPFDHVPIPARVRDAMPWINPGPMTLSGRGTSQQWPCGTVPLVDDSHERSFVFGNEMPFDVHARGHAA